MIITNNGWNIYYMYMMESVNADHEQWMEYIVYVYDGVSER